MYQIWENVYVLVVGRSLFDHVSYNSYKFSLKQTLTRNIRFEEWFLKLFNYTADTSLLYRTMYFFMINQ